MNGQARTAVINEKGLTFLCPCGESITVGIEYQPRLGCGSQLIVRCICLRVFNIDWFRMGEHAYVRESLPEPPSRWQRFKHWLFQKRTTEHVK